jgi:hypothetical protein
VPEESLKQAKVLLLQQIALSESSVRSIAEGLICSATNGLPLNEPLIAADMYGKLTPPQQVQAAFAKWIRPHDFVKGTQGPNSKWRHFRPSDGIRLSCIAATSSLEPDPQRVITLTACVNGTSTGCTRAAVRI